MTNIELLEIPVKHIMTKNVQRVSPNITLNKVDEIFNLEDIHHLPVLDEKGQLIGIVSQSDLLLIKHWGSKFGSLVSQRKNEFLLTKLVVSDIMTKNVDTVSPDDTLATCTKYFYANKYHALPVLDKGTLVGIISSYDLLTTAFQI